MQTINHRIFAFASGALLLLGFLFIKSQAVSAKKHLEYSEILAEQMEMDSQVNQSILRTRYELRSSDDFMVKAMQKQEILQERLSSIPSFVSNQSHLQDDITETAQVISQKASLLETFKTQNAVLKTSLTYLPKLVQELRSNRSKLGLSDNVEQSLAQILDNILLYSLSSEESLAQKIEKNLTRIEQQVNLNVSRSKDLKLALSHVRIILEQKPQMDELTNQLLDSKAIEQITKLENNYQTQYQSALATASTFQILTSAWLMCILGTITYLILRQQQRATLRTTGILSSITDSFIALRKDWQVTYINPQAAETFHLEKNSVVGTPFSEILPEEIVQPILSHFHVDQGIHDTAKLDVFYAKTEDWFEVRAYPSVDGYSIFLQKITVRKQSEHTLLKLNQDLKAQSLQLNQTMIEAQAERHKAEQANQSKSEFLANMSHELRTPLNAIIGYGEMLAEDAEDIGQIDFVPDLQKIQGAGKHLLQLINTVLDLSKVEAGKMELYRETVEIKSLLQSVVSTIHPLADQNSNTLIVNCPENIGHINTDITKLRQSLFNLLSNACKFTENGSITLSVYTEPHQGRNIYFEVSDTGIGMSLSQLDKIFKAFTQADTSTTRQYGGTGLGLTITKEFITLMGGDVTVESFISEGTTFKICLPRDSQECPAIPPAKIDNASTSNKIIALETLTGLTAESTKILIIDDDVNTQEILQRTLSKEGYEVFCTSTAEEGLRLAKEIKPNIIALDVYLEDTSGWFVLKLLKTDPQLADIPIIMISMMDETQNSVASGAAEFLTKPIERERLLAVMEKYSVSTTEDNILVVEDDEHSREILCRLLTKEDWRIQAAEDGRKALNALEENPLPSLILMDLNLPEFNGFELLRTIRQTPKWKKIPVIVVTAQDLTMSQRAELGETTQGIFQKGNIDHQQMLSEIEEFISL